MPRVAGGRGGRPLTPRAQACRPSRPRRSSGAAPTRTASARGRAGAGGRAATCVSGIDIGARGADTRASVILPPPASPHPVFGAAAARGLCARCRRRPRARTLAAAPFGAHPPPAAASPSPRTRATPTPKRHGRDPGLHAPDLRPMIARPSQRTADPRTSPLSRAPRRAQSSQRSPLAHACAVAAQAPSPKHQAGLRQQVARAAGGAEADEVSRLIVWSPAESTRSRSLALPKPLGGGRRLLEPAPLRARPRAAGCPRAEPRPSSARFPR